jgi:hypothetical protein
MVSPARTNLLKDLGTHACGKGCLYIKRLSDVHLPTLKKIVAASVRNVKQSDRRSHSLIVSFRPGAEQREELGDHCRLVSGVAARPGTRFEFDEETIRRWMVSRSRCT